MRRDGRHRPAVIRKRGRESRFPDRFLKNSRFLEEICEPARPAGLVLINVFDIRFDFFVIETGLHPSGGLFTE